MKITTPLLLLSLLVAGSGCHKATVEPVDTVADDPAFVPGELAVGIKEGVTMAQTFRFVDSLAFPISTMSGFFHDADLPKDSVAYVKKVLLTKPYLNK